MAQLNTLFQAILSDPEDDNLRLVYADRLEEQGDCDRAEYIRLAVELARIDDRDPDGANLRHRLITLSARNREVWQDALPDLPEGATWGRYHRGFVDEILLDSAAPIAEIADLVLPYHPVPNAG
jgi:uncharacterized protein (TIGR02996 family)